MEHWQAEGPVMKTRVPVSKGGNDDDGISLGFALQHHLHFVCIALLL